MYTVINYLHCTRINKYISRCGGILLKRDEALTIGFTDWHNQQSFIDSVLQRGGIVT